MSRSLTKPSIYRELIELIAPAWLLLCACGNGGGTGVDAAADGPDEPADSRPSGPCWSIEGSQLRGTITLGTGQDSYLPMPDTLPLVYGPQGGFHLEVHAQVEMPGFTPGNPSNILDPSNPRTRFRAFFVDTGLSINRGVCPSRLAYFPSGSDVYVLRTGTGLLYEVCYGTQTIFGRPVRVVVEILDASGGYATHEQIVTPVKPVDWTEPDYPDDAPCPPL